MIWHKCFVGDFPEDYTDEKAIRVLVVDSRGEYSIELREYVPELHGFIWHSHKRNIEAWTEIDPYK